MIIDEDKPLEPAPEPTAFDYSVAVAKGISLPASFVAPAVGSAVAFFDLITAPIRGKRFNEWCEKVRLLLNDHSKKFKELTPERLAASEEFNSAFAQAAQAAIRTHDEEKLEALRNAVLNTALSKEPDGDRQAIFVSIVDRLAPSHLRVLKALETPRQATLMSVHETRSPADWLKEFVPSLKPEDKDFIKFLIDDLQSAHLIQIKSQDSAFTRDRDWMTNFGHNFLRFISAPSQESK